MSEILNTQEIMEQCNTIIDNVYVYSPDEIKSIVFYIQGLASDLHQKTNSSLIKKAFNDGFSSGFDDGRLSITKGHTVDIILRCLNYAQGWMKSVDNNHPSGSDWAGILKHFAERVKDELGN